MRLEADDIDLLRACQEQIGAWNDLLVDVCIHTPVCISHVFTHFVFLTVYTYTVLGEGWACE